MLGSFWWVLLAGAVLGIAISFYLVKRAPPAYASTGRMIVGSKMSLPNASTYSEELNNFLGTQVGLMQSDVVSNRALVRLKTQNPALAMAPVDLEVTVSPKTSIFNLRAVSPNPDYATAFLQATMDEYVALKKDMLRDASDITKAGLQDVLAELSNQLQASKLELIAYGATNKEVYLQDQGNSAADYLAGLTRELADLKSELALLKTLTLDENVERLVGLQQSLGQQNAAIAQPGTSTSAAAPSSFNQSSVALLQPGQSGISFPNSGANGGQGGLVNPGGNGVQGGQFSSTMAQPPVGQVLTPRPAPNPNANGPQTPDQNSALVGSEEDYLKAKQMILLMKAQRDDLAKFLRPKHPKIIALNEDIDRMEKLLDIFRGQTKDQLQDREHTLEVQIKNLESDIKVWEVKTVQVSKKMADYQAIRDKIIRLQNISDSLFATESTVDLTTQASPESVSILEPATPAVLTNKGAVQKAAIAGLLGLAAAAALLMMIDRLDDRPHSFSEMQELFDETILGQIPRVKVKDRKEGAPVIKEEDDRHAFVEAYRNLRSSIIFFGSPEDHPKIILVTSAIPGDGKSLTTANLAITIARSGSRVLLVDADLRRGLLHKHFGIEAAPGLSEVLNEKCAWPQAVAQNSVPNLFILPRGAVPQHPGELFLKAIRDRFLKEAEEQYDYVLIDSAPVMAADDVSNLAPHVDGVLMVVRANHTSGRVARAALDLLNLRKANVLGIVFNGVKPTGGDYYYYRYKDYYSKSTAA